MELNNNIPHFECFVRDEFLYGLDESHSGNFTHGICHGIATIAGRALGFHVLLDNGAHIGRLPIHAITTNINAKLTPIHSPWVVQLWDCFSTTSSIIEFEWLKNCRVKTALADKSIVGGTYMFTVDYWGTNTAENAGDAGWKCHHIINLDDGRIAAQPNNRICWFEPSLVTPFNKPPSYVTMPMEFSVEDGTKWRTDETNRMFYDINNL